MRNLEIDAIIETCNLAAKYNAARSMKQNDNSLLQVEAERLAWIEGLHFFAVSVVIPLAFSILGVISTDLYNYSNKITYGIWAFVVFIQLILTFKFMPSSTYVLKCINENNNLKEQINILDRKIKAAEKWALQSVSSTVLRDMSIQYVINGVGSLENLSECLDDILAPFYLEPGQFLAMGGSEKWSFGVYLYSQKRDELLPVWRRRSLNHPSSGSGRTWGRGQGHVGKAFVDAKPIITGDASHPDVVQLCGAPATLERDYDAMVYRSFASIPIGPYSFDNPPYGVLIATSDHKDRFDEDAGNLLMHFAETIGAILALSNVDYDGLEEESSRGEENGD